MLIKMFGACVLMLSAVYFSYVKITASRKRISEVYAFIDMITKIKNEIYHFSKPLPEIFSDYKNDYFQSSRLIESIKEIGAREAIKIYSFSIKNETSKLIINFFEKIGEGYREDEVNLCTYTLERLTNEVKALSTENKSAEKLYRGIPILAVLSVILMLI